MKKELEEYLIKKFPKIYTTVEEKESFTSFKFECENGWFRIILWLSRYLQDYIDQQNNYAKKYPDKYLPVKQIKVSQVKEKFGILKFYTEGGNERTSIIISFIEYISGYICEITGNTENVGINKSECFKTIQSDLCKDLKNFTYIDDEELRNILK